MSRQEIFEQMLQMGYEMEEIWALISEMDFAEDYDD